MILLMWEHDVQGSGCAGAAAAAAAAAVTAVFKSTTSLLLVLVARSALGSGAA